LVFGVETPQGNKIDRNCRRMAELSLARGQICWSAMEQGVAFEITGLVSDLQALR
jgi:hypothetical protein